MPTRVIDVGSRPQGTDSGARLVITDGLREPYLALSYCWGPGASKSLTLTRNNLSTLTHSLPGDELSAAHKDMFRLAGDLGIRYVWIDALCIIQGDPEDWEYESPRMGRVYGNALMTVIAARSGDSCQGFVENNLDQKPPPCPLPLERPSESVETSGLFACLPRSREYGPVSDRAWCFQELLLSRRSLVYGEEQLFFGCRERIIFEDGHATEYQPLSVSITAGPSSHLRELNGSSIPLDQHERVLQNWYSLLTEYTKRKLSNPCDIFAGVSSIAQLASVTLESRYLAGIWEGDMARGLLWKSRYQVQRRIPLPGRGRFWEPIKRPQPTYLAPGPIRRAPSWSWAAVQGPIMQFTSSNILRKMKDKVVVRPKHSDPDRWTTQQDCGANVLHMSWCELQVIGRLKMLQVMNSKNLSHCAPTMFLTWQQRYPEYRWVKISPHGVLLESVSKDAPTQVGGDQADSISNVMAIGVFDIAHEAVSHVWCLRLVDTEGLMLVQAGDGKYARAGWFLVQNREWFEQGDEVEVSLV